jgi:hypothetical protein
MYLGMTIVNYRAIGVWRRTAKHSCMKWKQFSGGSILTVSFHGDGNLDLIYLCLPSAEPWRQSFSHTSIKNPVFKV